MATALEPLEERSELLVHLRNLDSLLRLAVNRARVLFAAGENEEAFRGVYISEEEIDSLMSRGPATLSTNGIVEEALRDFWSSPRIEALSERWEFTYFDTAVLLLAMAPEVDLRYERIFAYLQDDVTKRKPTVDFALNLFCTSLETRVEQRHRFAPDAPLLRSGLLRLLTDPSQTEAPLLGHYLRLDQRAIQALLGNDELDSRLASFCRRSSWAPTGVDLGDENELVRRLPAFASSAKVAGRPVRLLFSGPSTSNKQQAAEALAAASNSALLTADMERGTSWRTEPSELASLLKREATLSDATLFLNNLKLDAADEANARTFINALSDYAGTIVIASESPWVALIAGGDRYLNVPFNLPTYETRGELWQQLLANAGIAASPEILARLTSNFQLAPERIQAAVMTARQCLEWKITAGGKLQASDIEAELMAAARGQTGSELSALTSKIKPVFRWNDIVLPADTLQQLKEICARLLHGHEVLDLGGFGKKLSTGKGIAVLFAGPSGTGKTMAAEIIANELGLDLFRIDLSSVVSKYIGETEKNLERIFAAAVGSNSILLFDEADAIFGKRSAVNDAHDRYANVEISYLLQKMEQYEGVTILTTNLRGNIDEGFWRRLAFTVHFPFPEETTRLEIWKRTWPQETEVDTDVDFAKLAQQFKLSGGNIRNIALSAAFLAAPESRPVRMSDLLQATRREYAKTGKEISTAELEDAVH